MVTVVATMVVIITMIAKQIAKAKATTIIMEAQAIVG